MYFGDSIIVNQIEADGACFSITVSEVSEVFWRQKEIAKGHVYCFPSSLSGDRERDLYS